MRAGIKLGSEMGSQQDFRMRTAGLRNVSIVLGIADCMMENRTAIYAAVPITSGRRLWDLAKRLNIFELQRIAALRPRLFERDVFEPNLEDARRLAAELRRRHSETVVDPSRLFVPGWNQKDYRDIWRAFISKKVSLLVLADGWQYSLGCVEEAVCAVQNKVQVRDEGDNPISRAEMLSTITDALAEAKASGLSTHYLGRARQFFEHNLSMRNGRRP
jgi:hypothetical protein